MQPPDQNFRASLFQPPQLLNQNPLVSSSFKKNFPETNIPVTKSIYQPVSMQVPFGQSFMQPIQHPDLLRGSISLPFNQSSHFTGVFPTNQVLPSNFISTQTLPLYQSQNFRPSIQGQNPQIFTSGYQPFPTSSNFPPPPQSFAQSSFEKPLEKSTEDPPSPSEQQFRSTVPSKPAPQLDNLRGSIDIHLAQSQNFPDLRFSQAPSSNINRSSVNFPFFQNPAPPSMVDNRSSVLVPRVSYSFRNSSTSVPKYTLQSAFHCQGIPLNEPMRPSSWYRAIETMLNRE